MPAIEELRIHVEEDILLEQFGRIVNIVDRLGNIKFFYKKRYGIISNCHCRVAHCRELVIVILFSNM